MDTQEKKEHRTNNKLKIQRSNSYPGAMITHIAADGEASEVVLISPFVRSPSDLSAISNSAIETAKGGISFRAKMIRRALALLGLGLIVLGQITVSVALKKNGIIEKDLHDIVSERLSPVAELVIPELQHQLELFETRMLDTIERAKFTTQEKLRPGFQLAQKHGAKGKYPVVMVPGFVTSGLEVWKGKSCMENVFRERVWGGLASAQYWLRERYCIMENLALDPITGGDPEDIKLRSSQGFGAADFFVGNDWMCK